MEERPEKMYGLFGLNHHLLEKNVWSHACTGGQTEEEENGKESCILGSQKPQLRNSTDVDKYDKEVLATRFD